MRNRCGRSQPKPGAVEVTKRQRTIRSHSSRRFAWSPAQGRKTDVDPAERTIECRSPLETKACRQRSGNSPGPIINRARWIAAMPSVGGPDDSNLYASPGTSQGRIDLSSNAAGRAPGHRNETALRPACANPRRTVARDGLETGQWCGWRRRARKPRHRGLRGALARNLNRPSREPTSNAPGDAARPGTGP